MYIELAIKLLRGVSGLGCSFLIQGVSEWGMGWAFGMVGVGWGWLGRILGSGIAGNIVEQ